MTCFGPRGLRVAGRALGADSDGGVSGLAREAESYRGTRGAWWRGTPTGGFSVRGVSPRALDLQ